MSGAGEYIDRISRELEVIYVLFEDGTSASAELLEHLLAPL